jgi:hypothetical protein
MAFIEKTRLAACMNGPPIVHQKPLVPVGLLSPRSRRGRLFVAGGAAPRVSALLTAAALCGWQVAEYRSRVLPLFAAARVVHFLKTDARLANNGLPPALQRLRCRANYAALRFAPPIQQLAARLVARLRRRAPHYLALHLRFEKVGNGRTPRKRSADGTASRTLLVSARRSRGLCVGRQSSRGERRAHLTICVFVFAC